MGISNPGGSSDAYADMIANQQEYISKLTQRKIDSKESCEQAETGVETGYADYRVARNLFDECRDEKATLEANLEKLKAEMNLKMQRARESALAQGKSEKEIDLIMFNIQNEYAPKIAKIVFNISRVGATGISKHKTMDKAEVAYRNKRFENIFATNDYLGVLSSLFNAQLDLGKMLQNKAFVDSQQKGWTV